jgi:F-type H+-transporting ATPase subunit alpha
VQDFEAELFRYIDNRQPDIWESLRKEKQITDDIKAKLDAALKAFQQQFVSSGSAPAAGKPAVKAAAGA